MKSLLKIIDDHGDHYEALAFVCPGCAEMLDYSGLHLLPIGGPSNKRPTWTWDRNLYRPTLEPSILTGKDTPKVCHSWLKAGIFEFLPDCTHSLANQHIEIPDLPNWFIQEEDNE